MELIVSRNRKNEDLFLQIPNRGTKIAAALPVRALHQPAAADALSAIVVESVA